MEVYIFMNNIPERLAALRKLMNDKDIDCYVVPTADFHQSEYVGDHFKARMYITGFSGSAGTALICKDAAYLWTDGRYFIQATAELEGTGVELIKMGEPDAPVLTDFLSSKLSEGQTLAFDGRVVSMGEGQEYERIATKNGAKILYDLDLIDEIWKDRPPISKEPAFALELRYAGESTADKIARVREAMSDAGASAHVVTTIDDICWTLNIRGNDIDFFPLVLSYGIVTADKYHLYIDESKLDNEIKASFAKDGIVLHPYNDIYEDVRAYGAGELLLIDPKKINYALYNNISDEAEKIEAVNPEINFKTIKNDTELENIRKAQIKDSIAHVRFMKWLKENVGKTEITEITASEKLDSLRREMGNFIRPSFDPISSYGSHAAIVHYAPSPETDIPVEMNGMLLTDTGAGYYEGSTDITRTYVFGQVPQKIKEDFTLVAISNLTLSNAIFLKGCTGVNLDSYARKPFWDRHLNYNHGTGHGVGYLLNIHEGPAGFRWKDVPGETCPLATGMIITDEPGIYIEGSHGIRLENELLVTEDMTNEYGTFMKFETLTLIPFDLDAIVPEFMTAEERALLNAYHKQVFEALAPHLSDSEKEWLAIYTREI